MEKEELLERIERLEAENENLRLQLRRTRYENEDLKEKYGDKENLTEEDTENDYDIDYEDLKEEDKIGIYNIWGDSSAESANVTGDKAEKSFSSDLDNEIKESNRYVVDDAPVLEVSDEADDYIFENSNDDEKSSSKVNLRNRLFPWLKPDDVPEDENELENNAVEDENESENTVVVGENDSENTIVEEENNNSADNNVYADLTEDENGMVDISRFRFNIPESSDEEEKEDEVEKKRIFPFFGKKKEKINYEPKHLRKTKKLERIRESKFFKKIKKVLKNKVVRVIAAVLIAPIVIGSAMIASNRLAEYDSEKRNKPGTSSVSHSEDDIPSVTAADDIEVEAEDVTDHIVVDKNKTEDTTVSVAGYSDSNSSDNGNGSDSSSSSDDSYSQGSDEEISSTPDSTSDEVTEGPEEVSDSTPDEVTIEGPEEVSDSTPDEIVDSNSYVTSEDHYSIDLDYNVGDPVSFDGQYIYKNSIDASNDENRYTPLYPASDDRIISLIRLVSPDGSEKVTIDANNSEKKEQLEKQGWTVESYNISNKTRNTDYEGWTPGKSLK